MWKHAQPVSTDFAGLPEDVAEAPTHRFEPSLSCTNHVCGISLEPDRVVEGLYYLGRPEAWKSSESSAKCQQRGFV